MRKNKILKTQRLFEQECLKHPNLKGDALTFAALMSLNCCAIKKVKMAMNAISVTRT
jgi:hypothetical protein